MTCLWSPGQKAEALLPPHMSSTKLPQARVPEPVSVSVLGNRNGSQLTYAKWNFWE